jgi:hypothetical protein
MAVNYYNAGVETQGRRIGSWSRRIGSWSKNFIYNIGSRLTLTQPQLHDFFGGTASKLPLATYSPRVGNSVHSPGVNIMITIFWFYGQGSNEQGSNVRGSNDQGSNIVKGSKDRTTRDRITWGSNNQGPCNSGNISILLCDLLAWICQKHFRPVKFMVIFGDCSQNICGNFWSNFTTNLVIFGLFS